MEKNEIYGTILALLTAVVSGVAIPLNKVFLVDLDPAVFTAVRALIIGVVFLILAGAQSKFKFDNFKKAPWSWLLAIGIIGGGIAFLMYFTGLKLTTAARGAFLQKALPIYIAILAFIFLKEKIDKKQWAALGVMFVGLVTITLSQVPAAAMWADPALGDLLILAATVLWAVEAIIAKKAMLDGESNFVVTFARMFFGALTLWGAVVLLGKWDLVLALSRTQILNLLISTGALTLYVLFWYWAIKLINVSKAAMFLLLAPVVSLLLSVFWLGEPAPLLQLGGSALILVGAIFVARMKSELVTGA